MNCKSCLCEKPVDAFYASNKTRCKECIKASVRENRLERIEHYRQYDRMRSSQPHRMANNFKQSQAWREKYPNRMKAQNAVNNAVRDGRLKKQPCMVCGEKAVAHHPDYSKFLDVIWLCQPHHKEVHAMVEA